MHARVVCMQDVCCVLSYQRDSLFLIYLLCAKGANELVKEIMNLNVVSAENHMGVQSLLIHCMSETGGDVYFQL
jgi:hypothetical protein